MRGVKQRNKSDQYNGLEMELGPDTGVYCDALFRSHSETNTKHTNVNTFLNTYIHSHLLDMYLQLCHLCIINQTHLFREL